MSSSAGARASREKYTAEGCGCQVRKNHSIIYNKHLVNSSGSLWVEFRPYDHMTELGTGSILTNYIKSTQLIKAN